MVKRLINLMHKNAIFLDFDGVIKESVKVKSDALEKLFRPFGEEKTKSIIKHHEENSGVSRYEKFPLYLSWCGLKGGKQIFKEYDLKFSQLVVGKVIESQWVVGALTFLRKHYRNCKIFLITATPQEEIETIAKRLGISNYFNQIIGAPTAKVSAIEGLLVKWSLLPEETVMIGDSISDFNAADLNYVPFILRKTELNVNLQYKIKCRKIESFYE